MRYDNLLTEERHFCFTILVILTAIPWNWREEKAEKSEFQVCKHRYNTTRAYQETWLFSYAHLVLQHRARLSLQIFFFLQALLQFELLLMCLQPSLVCVASSELEHSQSNWQCLVDGREVSRIRVYMYSSFFFFLFQNYSLFVTSDCRFRA